MLSVMFYRLRVPRSTDSAVDLGTLICDISQGDIKKLRCTLKANPKYKCTLQK